MKEMFLTAMFFVVILIQAIAIGVNFHLINIERKYCKNCSWWSELGATFFVVLSFVPIIGIAVPIGFSVDCLRNVIEEIQGKKQAKYKITLDFPGRIMYNNK